MDIRSLPIASILVGFGSLGAVTSLGCASKTAERAPEAASPLRVSALVPREGERRPAGWVYAKDRDRVERSLCVYIWTDGSWTLAAAAGTGLGYFGDILASGRIGTFQEDGFAPLIGFPRNAFDAYDQIWVGGEVRATFRGQPVDGS